MTERGLHGTGICDCCDGPMVEEPEGPRRIGICFVDAAETFWWDATDAPNCPACPNVDDGQHRFFIPEHV